MTLRALRRFWTVAVLLAAIPDGVAGQKVLVVYSSATGHTALMAEAVAAGARSVAGADVRLLPVDRVSHDDVAWADALIVGSPVHSANISPPVSEFLNTLPFDGEMRDKIGAAFVTAGGMSAGEEAVQLDILRAMLVYNMIIVGGPTWTEAFGASAVTGEAPFADTAETATLDAIFTAKGSRLGARVAEVAKRLGDGGGR
ncbi:MAG: NAD(P)H-dependent oxidoreductase [Gemmatimonadota bacterium]|jgi:multimeric flavodoxin WrbA